MTMRGARRQRREQAAELGAAAAEALADVTCPRCWTFEGRSAHIIAHENGRCLPPGAYGQLVQLPDGRWAQRWRHPELR